MAINSEQIKKDIIDQLYWDRAVDASHIMVDVSDGRVTLKGSVPSLSARRTAYTDAVMIPGVVSVDDRELRVELPPALPAAIDDELKMRVEKVLSWNADIDATEITVSVNAGYVTLSGHVDAYWKKIQAEELVSDMLGVREVENALSVVPTESRTDKSIADDIMSALKRRIDVDINLVDVTVENGVVTLSGTVPNWSTLLDVERIPRYTAGVVEVINDLAATIP